ncbi:MAG: TonB-dependent receptor [Calditrichaeota bacterium]|nr:TonB-dependent receptor [Calditrichota bacterium]
MKQGHLSLLIFLFLALCSGILAQSISGKVIDGRTGEALAGANVVIKNTFRGAVTDLDGNFTIDNVSGGPFTVIVTYVGYKTTEFQNVSGGTNEFKLDEEIYGEAVVVTASRKSETILESPVTIEKMDVLAVKEAPAAEFYDGLANMKGVDFTTSSMGMKVINMRGFNSTSPDRFVQFVDGVDNQAPALNFPAGNLVGMSELDVESVEIISGAASALYGPNAFNGVLSMTSKDPWAYPGISASIKTGSLGLFSGAARIAHVLNDKFAFKVNFGYMTADDWEANSPINQYGTEVALNFNTLTGDAFLPATGLNDATIATFNLGTVAMTPYAEKDLVDYETSSMKINASVYYLLDDDLELSYNLNYGQGNGVYQGANRYRLKDFTLQTHKIMLKGSNFFLKAYTTIDNSGDSYDAVFTGIYMNKAVSSTYFGTYVGTYALAFAGGVPGVPAGNAAAATAAARAQAETVRLVPGTTAFQNTFNSITSNPSITAGGSKFFDESSLLHVEGQYNTTLGSDIDLIAGASWRQYDPESNGTIFRDGNHPNSIGDIKVSEFGVYTQLEKKFDDLKLTGSARFDKHENFDGQFTPRISAVYSMNEGRSNIRASYQTAFRSPTLQDQYIELDVGAAVLYGNAAGFYNRAFTAASVGKFSVTTNPADLVVANIDPVQPEKVSTWEVGYKGIINDEFYIDFNYYRSMYTDFIGGLNTVQPGNGIALPGAALDLATGNYRVYQVDANSTSEVEAEGFSLGMNYSLTSQYSVNANYTYSLLILGESNDGLIPSYNTPKNKWNLGFSGRGISNFGFLLNYKHVDGFQWEGSTRFIGYIPAYDLLDASVTYDFELTGGNLVTAKLAVSNITDEQHFEAFGAPIVGRMVVFGVGVDF